jgi:hypothetical protein
MLSDAASRVGKMDVYWLEQTQADVPGADDWLNASEAIRLNDMRIAKRRADWRATRALAASGKWRSIAKPGGIAGGAYAAMPRPYHITGK